MAGRRESLVYLDTHVAVWLHDQLIGQLSARARTVIDVGDLVISAVVKLELQYLFEIGRIRDAPETICAELARMPRFRVSAIPMIEIVDAALPLMWTRDLFDRLIVAEAQIANAPLVTKDRAIRHHYPLAVW